MNVQLQIKPNSRGCFFQAKHHEAIETADDQVFWQKLAILGVLGFIILWMLGVIIFKFYRNNEFKTCDVIGISWAILIFIIAIILPYPFWKYHD